MLNLNVGKRKNIKPFIHSFNIYSLPNVLNQVFCISLSLTILVVGFSEVLESTKAKT